MFLRRCERRKNGKRHIYWALVESYRTARGSRQRVVAYLGELKPSERSGWAQLGRRLSGKEKPQRSLFDPPHYEEPFEDETVLVRLKGVKLERVRDFGDVWMAWGLWRLLGLDRLLAELIPCGQEDVPWATVAAILVIARFCQPQSELHIETTWYAQTALDALLGVSPEKVHTDRLAEASATLAFSVKDSGSSPHHHRLVVPPRHAYSDSASVGSRYSLPSSRLSQRQNSIASFQVTITTGWSSSWLNPGLFHVYSGFRSHFPSD